MTDVVQNQARALAVRIHRVRRELRVAHRDFVAVSGSARPTVDEVLEAYRALDAVMVEVGTLRSAADELLELLPEPGN